MSPKLFAFLLYFCVCNFKYFESCGITTHTEIAHRAATHFDYLLDDSISIQKLIQKYQSAFQAGNPYPDSFYPNICKKGVFNYVSEDTHWVPFLNATINYIRKTYTKPYNEDALRLIVFTLGFTSHQIADVTWHSLGVDEGFLSTMGFVNFHGSFNEAHSTGDTGGDIVNQFELSTSYISDLGDWYVPYKDLYNIYLDFYGKEIITEIDIVECSSLLFIGRLGEQLAISLLYDQYSQKSPFLIDKLNDYFLGGIDDMATWTQLSWNKVLYMIENGVDKCNLDHNIINVNCNEKENKSLSKTTKKLKTREPKFLNKNFDKNLIQHSYVENGVFIKPSKKFENEFKKYTNPITENKFLIHTDNYENTIRSNTTYYVLNDYANLGWSMAIGDVNNDGSEDLIVGAPVYSLTSQYQNGLVFIKLSKNGLPLNNLNLEQDADIIISSPNSGKNSTKFGHGITVLDLNQDGFNDIVISAPSFNLENIKYQGQVYIYLGGNQQNFKNPSITITCENYEYCNLGWSVEKGDVDGDHIDDLIIGSPYAPTCGSQCGFVGVLLSKKKSYQPIISISNLDWTINGNMDYEWFGFNVKVKYGLLAVGAPQSRLCFFNNCTISNNDVQAAGRVYIFMYPQNKPLIMLNGEENFEQFGYDLDLSVQLNKTVIAISSYTKNCQLNSEGPALKLEQGGIVQIFDINDTNNPKLMTTLKSDRPYSGFGSTIKFFDVNGDNFEDLFISAQLRTDSLVNIGEVEQGMVYMFKGGPQFPTGNYTDNCPLIDLTPCPSYKANTVFENKQNRNRFGHRIEFIHSSKNDVQVIISAPRSDNPNSRLSGKINIFNL